MNNSYNSSNTLQREIYSMDMSDTQENGVSSKTILRHRILQTIVDLIVIIIIFVIFGLVYLFQDPKIRYFTCLDTDIFYPYKEDTIPFWAVGIFGTIGPVVFIVLIELINFCEGKMMKKPKRLRAFVICMFHGLSLFILGISLTLCLTEIGKRWIGRLRPHFIAVCQPDLSKLNCTTTGLTGNVYNAIYTGDNFCTNTNISKIKEARLSFPSGHSSYSCYTMLFLIVYVEARLILLRLRYIKPLIQLAAFSAAFVTCLSRISDYHHRGSDVIGGTILGIIIALFVTLIVGRVLWVYESEERYTELDNLKIEKSKL